MADTIEVSLDRTTYPVKLGKATYQAHAPKTLVAMEMQKTVSEIAKSKTTDKTKIDKMVESLMGMLSLSFSSKDVERLKNRLYDSDDPLDIPHLVEVMRKLQEQNSGENPTS